MDDLSGVRNGHEATDRSVLLLFTTTQALLRAEDLLLQRDFAVDVVPRPEGLHGLCGIALELHLHDLPRVCGLLEGEEIRFTVYESRDEGGLSGPP